MNLRRIRTFPTICMGRRSCKIVGRKMSQDANKAKLHSKIGKEVMSVIKKGAPNPTLNILLAAVLEKAKELDVPKEILVRNIMRASEKGQEAYIGKTYESLEICSGGLSDDGIKNIKDLSSHALVNLSQNFNVLDKTLEGILMR